jgi:hypothetical protein
MEPSGAPKGTPKEIIGRLNAATVEALADSAVRSRLGDIGVDIFRRERQTSESLGALVKAGCASFATRGLGTGKRRRTPPARPKPGGIALTR